MDGDQARIQLEAKFEDTIHKVRYGGILMGRIIETFDPVQIIEGRRHFEMAKSVSIIGVFALTDQVPFMGTRRLVGEDNVFQLGIQMKYQIDSTFDTENMTYTIREFIADNIDHDAFLVLKPDENVCEAVMRCAIFTNEDEMMRYIAFRVIHVMSSKYMQNCLLSLDGDSRWVLTYKPHGIEVTGTLFSMNQWDMSQKIIKRVHFCELRIQGRFVPQKIASNVPVPEEFRVSRSSTFFVPSYLQDKRGHESSAVLKSCDFCQAYANYVAYTIINLEYNYRNERRR